MKALTEERRTKLRAAQFGGWCSVIVFASLTLMNRDFSKRRFLVYASLFAASLGLVLFRWYRLGQKPLGMSATQG